MSNSPMINQLREFVSERDWQQFHTPENLAKSISIESAELLECFQWGDDFNEEKVCEELGDVLTYCILLADKLGKDVESLVLDKLELTKSKYPVEKSRGRSAKYTEL